ncbi:MAG: aminotransferase class IV [Prolixibacteraceae bacterium]
MDFVIVDENIITKDEMNITPFIREDTFQLSCKIWFGFGGIPFFDENRITILEQLKQLNLPVPAIMKNERELFRITKRMMNKNKFYRSGFIHLQLFCNDKQVHTVITGTPSREVMFPFRKKGMLLTYSSQRKYSNNAFNRFSFSNHTLWQVSKREIADTQFGNSIILNEKNGICETIHSNIFILTKNELLTPSLNCGCYQDVFRNIIKQLASELDFNVKEPDKIEPADLLMADEIFIAGEAYGMDWILGIENKRFVHHYSAVIHEKLNDLLQQKVH